MAWRQPGWRAQPLSHNYEEARASAEKAIKQDPGRDLAKLTLTAAQLRLKDLESALKTVGALAEEAVLIRGLSNLATHNFVCVILDGHEHRYCFS